MKASELQVSDLMVGDWVLDGTEYAQITSIICDGVLETTAREYSNIEVVEPIPLTAEILRKNFKDYEDGVIGWFCYGEGVFNIFYEDLYRNFSFNNVRYVHEVQHLMKIVGIDKEITL